MLYDADALDGLKEPETKFGILTALGAGGIDVLFRLLHKRFVGSSVIWKPMIQLGFDTHVVAPSEEVAAAQRTVALLYGETHRPLGQTDYQRFDDPEPHVAGSRGSVIVVPVTRKPSEALDGVPGPAHGGGVYIQGGVNHEWCASPSTSWSRLPTSADNTEWRAVHHRVVL